MKNYIFLTVAVLIVGMVYLFNNPIVDFKEDSAAGIHFHKGTWTDALLLSKNEKKPIFLDIYVTWCGPCKKLKKYTFSDEKAGQFYNKNFINVSINAEEGEGISIAKRYGVTSYPTLLFIDMNGNITAKSEGYLSSEELIKLGTK